MLRIILSILFVVIAVHVGVWGFEYYKMEKEIQKRESSPIHPKVNTGSIKGSGVYIRFKNYMRVFFQYL